MKADTLAQLAKLIDAPELPETVARFNAFAEAGRDEDFGRGEDEYARHFANPVLVPVDPDARVLCEDGSAVEGLYAVGNSAASLTGRSTIWGHGPEAEPERNF